MNLPDPLNTPELEFKALVTLVLIASVLFAIILWPFFGAVCWAIFISIVFRPLHVRFLKGSRGRPGMAASASMIVILLIVILPMGLVTATIAEEASVFIARLRSGEIQVGHAFDRAVLALPDWARAMLDRFGLSELGQLQQKIVGTVAESGQEITSRAFSIGQGTLEFGISFFVMLYVLFFLLRDGDRIAAGLSRSIPLQERHTRRLLRQFATVVRATVKGNIVVALVQGALGAAAFLVLGLPGPVLWGAVMAVLSLLPAVGSFIVWGPVAAYFFFAGEPLKGIGLSLWGFVVIGLVDNFLRPILVGKDARLPDYLVLVATLGGIVIFGLNGFVIGPVIAAIFLVSWEMLGSARRGDAD